MHRRGFCFVGEVDQDLPPSADASSVAAEPRKPSIAVLPFNLGQKPDTDYFGYGLTEDVIRLLVRNRWLDVLSRHSAAAFMHQHGDAVASLAQAIRINPGLPRLILHLASPSSSVAVPERQCLPRPVPRTQPDWRKVREHE